MRPATASLLLASLFFAPACTQAPPSAESSGAAPSSGSSATPEAVAPGTAASASPATPNRAQSATTNSSPADTSAARAVIAAGNDCQLLPADESRSNASLRFYLAELRRIVQARDTNRLLALVDKRTITSHGGGLYGRRDFAQNWALHRGPNSPVWAKLRRVLDLGGVFCEGEDGREFRLPYTQADSRMTCKGVDLDWFSTAVCVKPDAPVHQRPSATSPVVARLRYRVVTVQDSDKAWLSATALDGRPLGYVRAADLYFCADYTLSLVKSQAGGWRISAFAPYD